MISDTIELMKDIVRIEKLEFSEALQILLINELKEIKEVLKDGGKKSY